MNQDLIECLYDLIMYFACVILVCGLSTLIGYFFSIGWHWAL
jgi:hypothetical protein